MTPGRESAPGSQRAQVFLYKEQAEQFWRSTEANGATKLALGVMFDQGEVFHVYTAEPRTHFAGLPCRAAVRAVRQEDLRREAPHAQAGEGSHVCVLITIVEGDLVGRASVLLDAGWAEADIRFVPVHEDLARRSRGLIEVDTLAGRSVAVIGLGSGGSPIAVALAQAGVGRLVLVDRDRLEIGNVARHACGVGDLGRRKTLAVRDLVLGRNPSAVVDTLDLDVVASYGAARRALEGVDLIVGATDGDRSRFVINQMALDLQSTTIFGRVLARAYGGDVLRVRPGHGPCLACTFTQQFLAARPREFSRVEEVRDDLPAYVSDAEANAHVDVGLASDIAPISGFMTKLALLELCRAAGAPSLVDDDLVSDLYIWANRREGVYAGWAPMGASFTSPAILRWYGAANVRRRPDCGACAGVGDPSTLIDLDAATSSFFGS